MKCGKENHLKINTASGCRIKYKKINNFGATD